MLMAATNQNGSFVGKVAFVTGAGSGIGAASFVIGHAMIVDGGQTV
jgi:NADP-dependent 3-hydroxy acid dehydrogenase YdfG